MGTFIFRNEDGEEIDRIVKDNAFGTSSITITRKIEEDITFAYTLDDEIYEVLAIYDNVGTIYSEYSDRIPKYTNLDLETLTFVIEGFNLGDELLNLSSGYHAKAVRSVAFSPCGNYIVSSSLDRTVRVHKASDSFKYKK